MWEVVLILVVALIVLGPKQLTETARVLGKLYREIQKMASDVRNSVDLDSLISTDHLPESQPSSHKPEPAVSSKNDQTTVAPPGERSGPDFYAHLLESSKEEEETEEGSASIPQELQQSATDKAKKEGSTDQPDRENTNLMQPATLEAESKPNPKT